MDKERSKAIFMQFVMGLQQGAWMALGKVANPLTSKIEKDLHQVKAIIESLNMLKEKTMGNLSADEESFVNDAIMQLETNYVSEVKKEDEETERGKLKNISGKGDEVKKKESKMEEGKDTKEKLKNISKKED